jgi:hypothetical protein
VERRVLRESRERGEDAEARVERNLVESANAERCESPFVLQPAERALSGSPATVEVVCCQHLDEPVLPPPTASKSRAASRSRSCRDASKRGFSSSMWRQARRARGLHLIDGVEPTNNHAERGLRGRRPS